jgi:hypothetical protein
VRVHDLDLRVLDATRWNRIGSIRCNHPLQPRCLRGRNGFVRA